MRTLLLSTSTLLVMAAASCVVGPPPDEDPPTNAASPLWNPPRPRPLACTTVRRGGEARDPDLPVDPSGGSAGKPPILKTQATGDEANPGGTGGVEQIFSEVRVESPEQLRDVLNSTFQGTIIIPRDADWDLTDFTYENEGLGMQIKGHVALRGERGDLCSRPILRSMRRTKHSLFTVVGSDVLIEGIHFIGPMNGQRTGGNLENTTAINVLVYHYSDRRNRHIRVRDNEMREWTASAVEISSTRRDESESDWPASLEKPTRKSAEDIVVEQNFLHHNSRDGGGYGVSVGNGGHANVFGNVFEANRHAIASNGRPYSGYIAKYNYVQEGGFRDNGSYQQHFDVHGMGSNHYGGLAGQYYEISNNTFRGEQEYYWVMTRAAFMLRGTPSEGAYFLDNVAVHDDLGDAVRLKGSGAYAEDYRFSASGNSFDVDYSKELAVGDFDGDGRSDMFVANGTGWFVSRGGTEPWQFLNASRARIAELGFADMNGDRVTDVVWTPGDGRLGYFPFGAGQPVWIGQSPVKASDLRFGDFDGDTKMDVFRRDADGTWRILYGGEANWTDVGHFPTVPLAELRFGDFDHVPGKDLIAGTNKGWAIRSGVTGGWFVINGRIIQSLKDSVIADFDGDGRDDVAFMRLGQYWTFSREGRSELQTLRYESTYDSYGSSYPLYVGHFEKSKKAQVLTWQYQPVTHKDRQFLLWRGHAGSADFVKYSRSTMR